jgi:hypothetical protein
MRWEVGRISIDAVSFAAPMDMHTHFLRDDTRLTQFVAMRQAL